MILKKVYELQKYNAKDNNIFLFNNFNNNKYFGNASVGEHRTRFTINFDNVIFFSSEQLYTYFQLYHSDKKILVASMPHKYDSKRFKNLLHQKSNPDMFFAALLMKTKQSSDFRKMLLSTKNKTLVEFNTWGDNMENFFSAILKDEEYVGYNLHGRLLMYIREWLLNDTFNEIYDKYMKRFYETYKIKTEDN